MTKALIALLVLVGLGVGAYLYIGYKPTAQPVPLLPATTMPEVINVEPVVSQVDIGKYEVIPESSVLSWSAQKPLIDGYVNSGTFPIASGTIEVYEDLMDGMFTLDMEGLTVGLTAKKPGKESALEDHLRKADFFDVENYPTAEFRITSATPQTDVATTYTYDLTGDLTMRGVTNEVVFPVVIQKEGDVVVARAEFEIDRTLWDIKLGSGKFFTELGDNLIDDMVALNLTLVARPVVSLIPESASDISTSTATTTLE